ASPTRRCYNQQESSLDYHSDSETSSEDDDDECLSTSTLEAAMAAKQSIERYYKNFFQSLRARDERYEIDKCPLEDGTRPTTFEATFLRSPWTRLATSLCPFTQHIL